MKRLLPVPVNILHVSLVAASSVAIAGLALSRQPATAQTAQEPAVIRVSPDIPLEVHDPANLSEAAAFAWNEFIALTWPALPQGKNNSFPRGKPDSSLKYGQRGETGQVVWETFRHKVEAFPGQGNPNGYDPSAPDLGFGAKPDYVYSASGTGTLSGRVPPSNPNWSPAIPPFNNLDEVSQIGLNAMYAGVVDPSTQGSQSTNVNVKEKILFEAKVNEVVYQYAAQPRTDVSATPYSYFQSDLPAVRNIKFNSKNYLQTGDKIQYPPPYINLPSSDPDPGKAKVGSIEIKASFRRLGPKDDPSKYYTATVRYYTGKPGAPKFVDSNDPAVNEEWGLTSLHIIQKTPNAPTFVYATFGHINNILDANGVNVELPNGTTQEKYLSTPPYLPALTIIPSANGMPQKVFLETNGVPPVNTSSEQLYFRNANGVYAIYTDKSMQKLYTLPVNVNRRLYPIPPTITAANDAAQDAIRKANADAVWVNYRLINVQARPLDVNAIPAGEEPAFYLSNEVVETNPTLQHFSGQANKQGEPTDFDNSGKEFYKNVHVVQSNGNIAAYTMGGCMGCHGTQGQNVGGDFSVLLANGRVYFPDRADSDLNNAAVSRDLFFKYQSE